MLGFPNILAELELLKIISWKVKQIKIILGLEYNAFYCFFTPNTKYRNFKIWLDFFPCIIKLYVV